MAITSFFVKKAKKPDFNIKANETFHEGHANLYHRGKKSTFKELINSDTLVIGAHEPSMVDPDKVFKDLETLRDNGGMCYFGNVGTKGARRGPTACGLPLDLPEALEKLKKDAPSLSEFVEDIATAYKDKGGKSLRGLWWTYYRKDLKKSETIWVPIGMMKPHCDRLGGSTDRVIGTFGFNQKEGKQKLMSFQYGNDEGTKVWIKITHGMFVCLSEESSGHKVFSYNNKKVKHGVKNAEGTWTVTLEFGPNKRSQ